MASRLIKPNVGSTGHRRIVPMIGIDFIAGDLKKKGKINERYGNKPASMGGRTRKWSFVNFLLVSSNAPLPPATTSQQTGRLNFANATRSSAATLDNLTQRAKIIADFKNGKVCQGVDPTIYATINGWVSAVRYAQIMAGVEITPTYTDWNFE